MSYITFKRSATGWDSFSRSRKYLHDSGLSLEEARQQCAAFNADRTPAQIRRGTMLEFTTREHFEGCRGRKI